MEGCSEIAQFRENNMLHEESSERGLNGYAVVSRHETITARMERAAVRLLEMASQGRREEVVKILEDDNWC